MPFIDFTAGDVLTAAQMDTTHRQGVMVFDDAADRTTQLTGALNEGMTVFLKDTNRVEVYDGVGWVTVSSPWEAYTPSTLGFNLGNGTLNFRYRFAGWKTVHARGSLTVGSTTSLISHFGFGYPAAVSVVTSPVAIGSVTMVDATGTDYIGVCRSESFIYCYTDAVADVTPTVPFTWTTSDVITVDITFEIN